MKMGQNYTYQGSVRVTIFLSIGHYTVTTMLTYQTSFFSAGGYSDFMMD